MENERSLNALNTTFFNVSLSVIKKREIKSATKEWSQPRHLRFQREPESDGNKRVLCIPQISRTEVSLSDKV